MQQSDSEMSLMVLLRVCSSCVLCQQGFSGLAAILSPSPVKVSSIALFLTGVHPFSQCPDVVAYVQPPSSIRYGSLPPRTTEPQAFFLHIYLKTSFIHPWSQEPQLKNALIPTRIAYAGGHRLVTACNSLGHSSSFKDNKNICLWLFFGDVIADVQKVQGYEPRPIPALNSVSIPKSVAPSNSSQPPTMIVA